MRIIAGKYKRTPLKTLEGEDITRPTRDMVKEALFSSIMIYSDTTLLDLFSGSGAIGLEALSRGAKDVTFNDVNKDAVRIIKENLKKVREEREGISTTSMSIRLMPLKNMKTSFLALMNMMFLMKTGSSSWKSEKIRYYRNSMAVCLYIKIRNTESIGFFITERI